MKSTTQPQDAVDPEAKIEEYDEEADEDFNPDGAAAGDNDQSSSSDDEDDAAGPSKAKQKVSKRKSEAIEEELDSGDEATIKERRKRKRKKDEDDDADESAGEGGFIRTRAQRYAEKVEQKQRRHATPGHVTVDVDKLWADLSSLPIGRVSISNAKPSTERSGKSNGAETKEKDAEAASATDDLITIKKRIQYAGEVTEVEEQVPRTSKEAQRYLAEHPEADPNHVLHSIDPNGLQRPMKRPSIFEPNPSSIVKGVAPERLRPRAPSRLDVKRIEEEKRKKALKMSTVQKSALDWKGFVSQEGLRDELDEYGKSKKGFMAREAFLDRAAGAREQAARDARLKL
jgi:hypothetical protein